MNNLAALSITEAAAKLSAKDISAVELTDACLQEAHERNPALNVYLELFDDVVQQAAAADRRRAQGETHPLLGIPLASKDNILIEGRRASAASKMLEGYTASFDATVIGKLKSAGAVFLGRTNMDEFAMGGSTEHSAFGVTKNPLDETRVAGGSSGGSAAAVAAHMCLGALGSDTGGSIREPAAFCGVVGFKPTYGSVSRSGLIAMGSSLDQIGPCTRTVADAELLFDAIRGRDPLDSTSYEAVGDTAHAKVIGVPRHLFQEGVDADVLKAFESALSALREQGYEVRDIELKSAHLALAAYYVIMCAESSTNLARFDGVRYGLSHAGHSLWEDYAATRSAGFGAEVRRRIMLGTYVLSAGYYDAYYSKAVAAREMLAREFAQAFESVGIIMTPTAPSVAPSIGEKSDPLSMYLLDIFTVPANLVGLPALSVPWGKGSLPIGVQCMAHTGNDAAVFEIGKKLLTEA